MSSQREIRPEKIHWQPDPEISAAPALGVRGVRRGPFSTNKSYRKKVLNKYIDT